MSAISSSGSTRSSVRDVHLLGGMPLPASTEQWQPQAPTLLQLLESGTHV